MNNIIEKLKKIYKKSSYGYSKEEVFDILKNEPNDILIKGSVSLNIFNMTTYGFLENNQYEKVIAFQKELAECGLFKFEDEGLELIDKNEKNVFFNERKFHFHPNQIIFRLKACEVKQLMKKLINLTEESKTSLNIHHFIIFDMSLLMKKDEVKLVANQNSAHLIETYLKSLTQLKRNMGIRDTIYIDWNLIKGVEPVQSNFNMERYLEKVEITDELSRIVNIKFKNIISELACIKKSNVNDEKDNNFACLSLLNKTDYKKLTKEEKKEINMKSKILSEHYITKKKNK